MSLQTTFTPADFEALAQTDLSGTTCVVLDILRATSSMITALANGAEQILPVASIEEALAAKAEHPDALLCGERDGLRITATQTGGTEFDLGNSPREYTAETVAGKTLITTTTNGTRWGATAASFAQVRLEFFGKHFGSGMEIESITRGKLFTDEESEELRREKLEHSCR